MRTWMWLLVLLAGCEATELEDVEAEGAPLLAPCGFETNLLVRTPAVAAGDSVTIDCALTLGPEDVVTRRLIFEGSGSSGASLECNGATIDGTLHLGGSRVRDTIEVRSTPPSGTTGWVAPTDITVHGCNVIGSVRVWGMSQSGFDEVLKAESRLPGYVSKVRATAPRRIRFEDLVITAVGRNPFYLGKGVRDSALVGSEIRGAGDEVAVYLDAESRGNLIKGNYLHMANADDDSDPQLAIDGSSANTIVGNWFSALNNGGIYLFRNCGESGVVRYSTPSDNTIVNNVFYYDEYKGMNPAVYLGSRNWTDDDDSFCDQDMDFDGGSGADNRDFATGNVVMQNRIFKRSVTDMIRTRGTVNTPNFIGHNETVESAQRAPDGRGVLRSSGCHVEAGYTTDFLRHGESMDIFQGGPNGAPQCIGGRFVCSDGQLSSESAPCLLTSVPFACQASGNNAGCTAATRCETGSRIVAVRAACNLEFGTVSSAALAGVPANLLRVLVTSDHVADGKCWMRNTTSAISSGSTSLSSLAGRVSTSFGCSEHDANGGDCHIRGQLYCR